MTPIPPTMPAPRTVSWADDDEDTFDYEAWKATVDTSAPTVEDLGPLQPSCIEDDCELFFSVSKVANSPSARTSEQEQDQSPCIVTSPSQPTDLVPTEAMSPADFAGLLPIHAQKLLVELALHDDCALPAYPELSDGCDGRASPYVRKNYTQNWKEMKTARGLECRQAVPFRNSPLVRVMVPTEDPSELGAWREGIEIPVEAAADDVPDLQVEDNSEEDGDEVATPVALSSSPVFCNLDEEVLEIVDGSTIEAWTRNKDEDGRGYVFP